MSSTTEQTERSLVSGQWDDSIETSASSIYTITYKTINGELKDVLTSEPATALLRISQPDHHGFFQRPLAAWFDFEAPDELFAGEKELLRLVVGIACLHAFLQVNWTGPDLDLTPSELLLKRSSISSSSLSEETLNVKAIAELAYEGEPAYHLARSACFLRLAQMLFDTSFAICKSVAWWRLRAARIHQHLLDESIPLSTSLTEPLEGLRSGFAKDRDLSGRLVLEHGLILHRSGQDKQAAESFVRAAKYTGLEYELTGALGKRTKFQQMMVSQLVLLAESRSRGGEGRTSANTGADGDSRHNGDLRERSKDEAMVVPETLALDDDTLLEHTEFTSSSAGLPDSKLSHLDPSAQPALHPLDQCIVLSLCLNVKNASPSHGLTTEQMKPYVERVISHPQNWSVHTMALLLRSRLEAERTRTVERSTLQLQALIDQMSTSDTSLPERLLYIHSLPMPSKWELERELALRFLSLGVVRSALEIFERLEMWEEAVQCWQALERPEKGIAIVKDLLEGRKEESEAVVQRAKARNERRHALDAAREAKLWCLLGDLEPQNAVDHYLRAWDISAHKSGRAMRSLGGYYYTHGEFGKAIGCLQKTVAINPLLSRPWFILGCACIREERWQQARDSFSRCVSIDDEDAESWNNLASVYLRMGTRLSDRQTAEEEDHDQSNAKESANGSCTLALQNKLLAFRALHAGLKHSYDNWRMWANYMIVAMDIGEFAEAARAQARVVEERAAKIGAEAVDEDVLDRLVDAVIRAPERKTNDELSNPEAADASAASSVGITKSPNEGEGLRPRVSDLFERVVLPRVSSPRIYRGYARLLASQERWSDAVKYYLDAYRLSRAAMIDRGDEVDKTQWLQAINEVVDIIDILRNFGPRAEEDEAKESEGSTEPATKRPGKWRMQARSIVRTFMARTRDLFEDDPDWSKLVDLLEELKQ